MTARRIVIVGAGGFGREVLDIIEAQRAVCDVIEFVGFVDDGEVDLDRLVRRGAPFLGSSEILQGMDVTYVIGVGAGFVREKIAQRLTGANCRQEALIHPQATVGGDVLFGKGCIVAAGARLTTNIRCGTHVDVHVNATVGHDCVLADFVSLYPAAVVSGDVQIHHGATIGTAATVLRGLSIGEGAMVGAGAVVVKDVAPGTVVVGVPAQPIGQP
jgi:sugar O-acyltransferase (sialic acid O-acetyltransferase NeuD family)